MPGPDVCMTWGLGLGAIQTHSLSLPLHMDRLSTMDIVYSRREGGVQAGGSSGLMRSCLHLPSSLFRSWWGVYLFERINIPRPSGSTASIAQPQYPTHRSDDAQGGQMLASLPFPPPRERQRSGPVCYCLAQSVGCLMGPSASDKPMQLRLTRSGLHGTGRLHRRSTHHTLRPFGHHHSSNCAVRCANAASRCGV